MAKIRKYHAIFLLMLIQTFIATSAGFTAFFLVSRNHIAPGVHTAGIDLGGLERAEASQKLQKSLGRTVENKSLVIRYGSREFRIKFSDIDASLDSEATAVMAYGKGRGEALVRYITGYFTSGSSTVQPVVSFNEGKLRTKLRELKALIDRGCSNSYIYLDGNRIIKVPETTGYKLDIEKSINKIRNEIGIHMDSPMEFKYGTGCEIETVIPSVTIKDFKGVDNILSQYSTNILPGSSVDSIKRAAMAINGSVIYPKQSMRKGKALFSFNECLSGIKAAAGQGKEEYSQVASTLYAAALEAGIRQNVITRTPHDSTVDYIQPGLDVKISGNSGDLKFENTLGFTIAVLAEVREGKVKVSILGKKTGKPVKNIIKTEVEQRYLPTVMNMESQELLPGQKKMMSPGREGMKVKVYRIRMRGSEEIDRSLLYYDKYKAVEAIVQIGPNTRWYDGVAK